MFKGLTCFPKSAINFSGFEKNENRTEDTNVAAMRGDRIQMYTAHFLFCQHIKRYHGHGISFL